MNDTPAVPPLPGPRSTEASPCRDDKRREAANVAWVEAAFAAARGAKHRAIVFAFHSDPFVEELRYDGGPFERVLAAISAGADAFDGEVLVVHGHRHTFIVDRRGTGRPCDTASATRRSCSRSPARPPLTA